MNSRSLEKIGESLDTGCRAWTVFVSFAIEEEEYQQTWDSRVPRSTGFGHLI